ncbi:hypothetical protein [Flavobacterium rhizosphaerae]|uniref:Uncharacterized protein n=1 Tax=Flavobacterium rhizosphaerae TaxID=3163298 RepID=A0ABW8Z0D7_9FLAO
MSIIFSPPLDSNKLRMAYNNDIFRFYSDSNLQPKYCDISSVGMQIRLYPNPEGKFMFNFKSYIAARINANDFEDTIDPDLQTDNIYSFYYNFTSGNFIQLSFSFTITFESSVQGEPETTESEAAILSWIGGVEQLGEYGYYDNTGLLVLSPHTKDNTAKSYVKYWQGYPFDIAFYRYPAAIIVKNLSNLISQTFYSISGYIRRLYFSDGRTDESIENIIPLNEGFNELKITRNVNSPAEKDIQYLTVEKIPYKCGIYLKWLNHLGGYNYWLFENTYSIDRSTKYLGELDNDYYNIEDTTSPVKQIGKESQDTIKVLAELLTEEERQVLKGILDSPKIYMFTGQPFAQNGIKNWVEVRLTNSSVRIKNPRERLTNFSFDLELPKRYTQTL